MSRVQCGDADAFALLYDRHSARAFRVARSVSTSTQRAEEAVQEGFLSIWRCRASFRPEAGSFQGWAMRVVRNRAIDIARADAARPQLVDGAHLDRFVAPASAPLEDGVMARREAEAVRQALRQLPPAQAEVIVLAYYGGLSHTEIAMQLSVSSGTVKGRMRLGLEKLRAQFAEARTVDRRNDLPESASA